MARAHSPLLIVLVAGALLRVAVAIAYRPAIFYNDSFVYVRQAFNVGGPGLVMFAPDRPAGYPLVLHLLGVSLGWVTSLQHLAGLVGGVLVYWVMRRLGVGRWLAALGVAVVVLDSYGATLEQLILAEALFTFALTASAALVVGGRRWWALALAGASLAAACALRNTGYALIPVWIVFLLVRHRGNWVPLAAAVAGFATVFGSYLVWQHSVIGRWTPYATTASGWFLYSRVAPFGSCPGVSVPMGAAGLCRYTAADRGQGPEYYLFSGGPARRLFPDEYPGGGGTVAPAAVNRVLRDYAVAVIEARPLNFVGATLGDFVKFFEPGATAYGDDFETFTLVDEGRTPGSINPPLTGALFYNRSPAAPGHPFWPGAELRSYQSVVHTARWLLAILVIAVLACAVLRRTAPGRGLPARPGQIVLIGGPLLALLVQAATAQFAVRYEIPFVGLIVAGGLVAVSDLVRLRGARVAADRAPAPDVEVVEPAWLGTERPRVLVLIALVPVAAIALVAWLLAGSGAGQPAGAPPATVKPIGPVGFTASGLRKFVGGTLKQPVYWAGPRRGATYEAQRTASGNVYLRYLRRGASVGDPRSAFLLVATYPYPDALRRLGAIAHGAGTTLAGGAFVLSDKSHPTNVHLAFPGTPYEVEVFDPAPGVARRIALSGAVVPVARSRR